MSTKLDRIAAKARSERKLRFTSLGHLLTPEFLKETWKQMNRKAASGVDGETAKEFEKELDKRVEDLCAKVREGQYVAPPVRRVYIPKSGKTELRPLGIPTTEDRLLQRAVARILDAVFEADFLECSYGYRRGLGPHKALQALRSAVVTKKVNYVYEADIRGYFNHINHDWLRQMVAHRIADPVILRLVGKWLNAGVMENGVVARTEEGSPQGGPISPILANVYLHYVLDVWFERQVKKQFQGEAHLIRFVDDFVIGFQNKDDAEDFHRELGMRLAKFNLELAPEKTRILRFGRFAESNTKYGERPETFTFLGFKHVCGSGRKGEFALVRIPSVKSCRKFLDQTHDWLKGHIHWRRRDQQRQLGIRLQGFYRYFALHHCKRKLDWVRVEVQMQWIRTLRQQSQRHRLYWSYLNSRTWFELPYAETLHPAI
jgi:group II intron reverse transcriptase/maturase